MQCRGLLKVPVRLPARQRTGGGEVPCGIGHDGLLGKQAICDIQQARLVRLRRSGHVT